jgi:adenylate cyclase
MGREPRTEQLVCRELCKVYHSTKSQHVANAWCVRRECIESYSQRMQSGPANSDSAGPVPAADVRAQLGRILASTHFSSSQRLCRFLKFIVDRTLENDVERLKEFVVAVEVFDRNQNYDPNVDSIVRVEARRLRTKLKAYYDADGRSDPLTIELRAGSYVPLFRPVAQATGPSFTTVAVLPFVNMSSEPEQDYFCDGITEELINALAAFENLSVVARTSAFQFKGKALDIREVGDRLGAQVVVEGSVRKAGDQLRVTAQAIDASKGYHLWSETYRRELKDIFAIQEELSSAIAHTLRAKLPDGSSRDHKRYQPTFEAYTGFLKAMYQVHQQNIAGLYDAMEQFRTLIRSYPGYAQPHAGLAAANGILSLFGVVSGREVLPEMRRSAEEAVRVDSESADAWAVMAGLSAHYDYDWAKSEQCFRRAVALQPGSSGPRAWYGSMMAMQGRFAEAESELLKVAQLNPLAASDHTRIGYLHYLRGEHAEARARFDTAIRLDPDFPEGRLYPGLLFIQQGNFAAAVDALLTNLDTFPLAVQIGLLGAAYGFWGKAKASSRCLARLNALAADRYVTPLASAWVYLGLGDLDNAFTHLERAVDDRTVFAQFLKVDPLYEPLRAHPRYRKVLRMLNLDR